MSDETRDCDETASNVSAVALTSLPGGIIPALRLITVGSRTRTPGPEAMVIARHLYDGGDSVPPTE